LIKEKDDGSQTGTKEEQKLSNDDSSNIPKLESSSLSQVDKLIPFLQNIDKEVQKEPSSSGQLKVDNDDAKERCEEDGWLASKNDLKKIPNPLSSSTSIKETDDGSSTGTKEEQTLSDHDSSNIPKLESSSKSKVDNDDSKEKCKEDEKIPKNNL
jgi:hypothetical protein